MHYVSLGLTGLKFSRICLGMMSYGVRSDRQWHLTQDEAEPIVRQAVEAGVTFFDTADMYDRGASEEVTGRLLAKLFADREDYVLATKVYFSMGDGPNDSGVSRKHILSAIDASLRRLGVEYVDLYQIHRWDPTTPIEETMGALHDVVRAGKARRRGGTRGRRASRCAPGASSPGLAAVSPRGRRADRGSDEAAARGRRGGRPRRHSHRG